MLWETSYKDSASKQDLNPPRGSCRGEIPPLPMSCYFSWTKWMLTSPLGSWVQGVFQSQDRIKLLIIVQDTGQKKPTHTGICTRGTHSSLAMDLMPIWGYQEPLCLADAGVFTPGRLQVSGRAVKDRQFACIDPCGCRSSGNCASGDTWSGTNRKLGCVAVTSPRFTSA